MALQEWSRAQLISLFEKVGLELTNNTEEQFIKARIKACILLQLAEVDLLKLPEKDIKFLHYRQVDHAV